MYGNVVKEQLGSIASYICYTNGAPFLRRLSIALDTYDPTYGSEPSFGPLAQVLTAGRAPSLTYLSITGLCGTRAHCRRVALDELGDIYQAGGLASELEVDDYALTDDWVSRWVYGVVAFPHKGAALNGLRFYSHMRVRPPYPYAEASTIFADALKHGAFPCLKYLGVRDNEIHLLKGTQAADALIDAFAAGAPCAQTLEYVRLSDLSNKQEDRLENLLPNWDASA